MKRHYPIFLFSLLMLALAALASGCSKNMPLATNPPVHSQEKIQAVEHWDALAEKVATRVRTAIGQRTDLINRPIYVHPPNDVPFSVAFYKLLRTRLVSKGLQVSDNREADSVTINYSVQAVLHDSTTDWTPSLAAMGIGVVNIITGSYTTRSNYEIVINADMLFRNRYVMQVSTICYIDDDDWALYISPESFDPSGAQTRTVRLVNR